MVVNGWLMDGYYDIIYLVGGWAYPSEKWWSSEVVSWDDEIPKIWKQKMFQTTKQIYCYSNY